MKKPHKDSVHYGDTWIEPEELTYPSGGFLRRARVRMPDGELKTVKCSIPDSFWTIPARIMVAGKTHRGRIFVSPANEFGFAFSTAKDDVCLV